MRNLHMKKDDYKLNTTTLMLVLRYIATFSTLLTRLGKLKWKIKNLTGFHPVPHKKHEIGIFLFTMLSEVSCLKSVKICTWEFFLMPSPEKLSPDNFG